jgi:enoyl-CoA hydratase/carnithine racemase
MPYKMTYDIYDDTAPIYIEKDGAIGLLYFNRPDKFNAMSFEMWRSLPRYLKALDDDSDVRCIVVSGKGGKAFSAGADVRELSEIAEDAVKRDENRVAIREAQRGLARTKKPNIAMIDGLCVGGGCGLAIHCDMRFASDTSRFAITPAKLGIIYPLNDTKELVDLVGPSQARKLLFTADQIDTTEALRIGLIDGVYPQGDLKSAVDATATLICERSQYSIQMMKANIQAIVEGQVDDNPATANAFNDAHVGIDAQEGIKAFMEKRKPKFEWNG